MMKANVYSSSQYVILDCAENGDVIVETPYIEKWIEAIKVFLVGNGMLWKNAG
ncbi:hypothetical protein [Paenibacillus sp. IHBB 10380]|uniref:hypothetical protein n=1 Tax=Paenibacillus sp. IHBB 10380 TaxID=1566358 RepID=UPI000A9E2ACB|nr:hypothetical protein [Paenibacillus sp. IHBB 10380]